MTTALIIGLGGLGCPVALGLAEAGVARLRLVDDDRIDLGNLHRQVLFGPDDVGRLKVEVAAERLREAVPGLVVETEVGRFDGATARACLADVDVAIDGTDDPAARFVLNDAALATGTPAVFGGVVRFDGLVLAVGAGYGPCFRCLFESAPGPDDLPTCAGQGVLGALAGVVGHLQVSRALDLLGGDGARATGFVTTIDGLTGRVRDVPLPLGAGCPACGGVADHLDITADTCPMTYVRTRLALERLAPGEVLDLVMRRGEPSRNVPRSLREEGHDVICAGALDHNLYRVVVRRAHA